ncbi:MAG: hypothetical protein WA705_29690 [Candidatus Ozemobacteraceae bacterium]
MNRQDMKKAERKVKEGKLKIGISGWRLIKENEIIETDYGNPKTVTKDEEFGDGIRGVVQDFIEP